MSAPTRHDRRQVILREVREERLAQLGEYTDEHMEPTAWIARIAKHLGRAVTNDQATFRHAMVVVAALAVAAVEWFDERYR